MTWFSIYIFTYICLVYRYLSDLHAPGDPAWQCIVAQHKWILQLMQNCKEDFLKEQRGLETNIL